MRTMEYAARLESQTHSKDDPFSRMLLMTESKSGDYALLCADALRLRYNGEFKQCAKRLREAIQMNPQEPWGHYSLGYANQCSGHLGAAIDLFQHAILLCEQIDSAESRDLWVLACSSMSLQWVDRKSHGLAESLFPAWLSDHTEMRRISSRCIELMPERMSCWYVRGETLLMGVYMILKPCTDAGGEGMIEATKASAPALLKEVREAKRAFIQAAKLGRRGGQPKEVIDNFMARAKICEGFETNFQAFI